MSLVQSKQEHADVAARAAATFNPNRTSLFDSARVKGAALKAALRDVAGRLVMSTPGVRADSSVRVVFAGGGAYVKHTATLPDKNGERKVAAAIFLPDVDDAANVPRALADEMLAMLLHEIAHAFFTSAQSFRNGIDQLAHKHAIDPARVRDVINAIEDVRIERALMASGYAAGFRGIVGALLGRLMSEAVAEGCLQAFRAGDQTAVGFALAYGLRRTPDGVAYVPGCEVIRPALAPSLRAAYDMVAAEVPQCAADVHGTAQVVAIADRVFTMLPKAGKTGPTQPGDGPPCEDGEPGTEQGEPGKDGEPGEPGDKPTEPGTDGPQGDEPGEGEGEGEPGEGDAPEGEGEPGEGEGEPGEGEGEPGEGEGGDTDGPAGEGEGEGGNSSSTPTGSKAGEGKVPPPGTFTSEPEVREIPPECKPTTESQIFEGVVQPPAEITGENARRGARYLDAANVAMNGRGGIVVSNLRRLFARTDNDTMESGRKHGRLRAGALSRVATGADNVFMRRTLQEGASAACAILIDGSGSMGRMAETANAAGLLIVQALAKCPGVRTQVQVFQDGGPADAATEHVMIAANEQGMRVRMSPFTLHTFKRFEDNVAVAYANARPITGGGTPDLEALQAVGRALGKRSEPRKVLLVVVDGGTSRYEAIDKECASLKRAGVAVVAIGIGVHPPFPNAVCVHNVSDLAGVAMRAACDAVSREFAI